MFLVVTLWFSLVSHCDLSLVFHREGSHTVLRTEMNPDFLIIDFLDASAFFYHN